MNSLIKKVESAKIFAIIRGIALESMHPLFEALLEGGIELAEITMNTPDALVSIGQMQRLFGAKITIGAGTVLDADMAKAAIDAGAGFLVAPNVDEGMIKTALAHNVLPLPGVMTPSEIVQARRYGAPLVKLFPASSLGPKYIKEIMGPLADVKIVAVGGINKDNANDFLAAGVCGVGVGGSLIDKKAIEEGNFKFIANYAKELKTTILP